MANLPAVQKLLKDATPSISLLLILRWLLVWTLRILFRRFNYFKSLNLYSHRLFSAFSISSFCLALLFGITPVYNEIQNCIPAREPRPHALIMVSSLFLLLSTSRFIPCVTSLTSLILPSQASPHAFLLTFVSITHQHAPDSIVALGSNVACIAAAIFNSLHCPDANASHSLLFTSGVLLSSRWMLVFAHGLVKELKHILAIKEDI